VDLGVHLVRMRSRSSKCFLLNLSPCVLGHVVVRLYVL